MPKTKTVAEQITTLQQIGEQNLQQKMFFWCALAAAFFLVLSIYTKNPIFMAFTAWALMALLPLWFTGPFLIQAAKALEANNIEEGYISIKQNEWSDSIQYSGVVTHNGIAWEIEFCPPQGWTPDDRSYAAKFYYLKDIPWPSLVVTEHGLLSPRSKPRKYSASPVTPTLP